MKKNIKIIFLSFLLFLFFFLLPKETKAVACPTTTGNSLILSESTVGANNCFFSASVDGVDNGTLTLASGFNLTISDNQTIVYGTLQKTGATIIISKNGGSLKKGYLFYQITSSGGKDLDSDGFICNGSGSNCSGEGSFSTAQKYYHSSTPAPSGHCGSQNCVRVSLATTTPDCYDSNANARPNQTAYFTVHRGDGSFDYNCNGTVEKKNTQIASCVIAQAPPKKFFALKSFFEKIKNFFSNKFFSVVLGDEPPLPPPPEGGSGPGGSFYHNGWCQQTPLGTCSTSVPDCGQSAPFREFNNFPNSCEYQQATFTQACR